MLFGQLSDRYKRGFFPWLTNQTKCQDAARLKVEADGNISFVHAPTNGACMLYDGPVIEWDEGKIMFFDKYVFYRCFASRVVTVRAVGKFVLFITLKAELMFLNQISALVIFSHSSNANIFVLTWADLSTTSCFHLTTIR